QKWPITVKRPYSKKEDPNEPLITGMRVIDLLFPVAKGGTIAIPGGFGRGKTVIQQSLAKWSDVDIVVFIGCGEPGNEIANVLKQFSELKDSKTGRPLLEHIILIANTSNMPVSAREASLFSGVTIAEYYRDMGYNVVVLADSTSRWAESLREISGLLEEMPAEEGYPAYLPSKLSSFYERAGVVKTLGTDHKGNERKGSLTIVGTISPPAGDFSEPVTATTKRLVQVFWALDPKLAYLKHYPAINWMNSYSNYPSYIENWWYERDIDWPEIDIEWMECRKQVNEILSKEQDLKYIIQLIGARNLPENQQLILFIAKLIKNGFLIQSAFDDIDNYTNTKKLLGLIKLILLIYNEGNNLIDKGILIEDLLDSDLLNEILRIRNTVKNDDFHQIEQLKDKLVRKLRMLAI
ncbi:MAG: V-type ATP synthase subunit A, partial [Candidatus Lokiarchaeota archaeon]|nr:V-type ATP synthase subunit A [Candidatus Lokiarchaeota archaeon]